VSPDPWQDAGSAGAGRRGAAARPVEVGPGTGTAGADPRRGSARTEPEFTLDRWPAPAALAPATSAPPIAGIVPALSAQPTGDRLQECQAERREILDSADALLSAGAPRAARLLRAAATALSEPDAGGTPLAPELRPAGEAYLALQRGRRPGAGAEETIAMCEGLVALAQYTGELDGTAVAQAWAGLDEADATARRAAQVAGGPGSPGTPNAVLTPGERRCLVAICGGGELADLVEASFAAGTLPARTGAGPAEPWPLPGLLPKRYPWPLSHDALRAIVVDGAPPGVLAAFEAGVQDLARFLAGDGAARSAELLPRRRERRQLLSELEQLRAVYLRRVADAGVAAPTAVDAWQRVQEAAAALRAAMLADQAVAAMPPRSDAAPLPRPTARLADAAETTALEALASGFASSARLSGGAARFAAYDLLGPRQGLEGDRTGLDGPRPAAEPGERDALPLHEPVDTFPLHEPGHGIALEDPGEAIPLHDPSDGEAIPLHEPGDGEAIPLHEPGDGEAIPLREPGDVAPGAAPGPGAGGTASGAPGPRAPAPRYSGPAAGSRAGAWPGPRYSGAGRAARDGRTPVVGSSGPDHDGDRGGSSRPTARTVIAAQPVDRVLGLRVTRHQVSLGDEGGGIDDAEGALVDPVRGNPPRQVPGRVLGHRVRGGPAVPPGGVAPVPVAPAPTF
jgi:hypothetical protein